MDANRSNGFLWDSSFYTNTRINYLYDVGINDTTWISLPGRYYLKHDNNEAAWKPAPFKHWQLYKDYFPIGEPTGTMGCGKIKNDTIFNTGQSVKNNEMSQDHLIGVLAGLTAIVQLVDDDMVVPTPQDDTAWLKSMAKVLGRRMMDNVSATKRVQNPKIIIHHDTAEPISIPVFDELDINWFLTNPVSHEQVLAGMNSWLFSYPLSEIGNNRFSPTSNYDPNIVCKTTGLIPISLLDCNTISALLKYYDIYDDGILAKYRLDHPQTLWNALIYTQKVRQNLDETAHLLNSWTGSFGMFEEPRPDDVTNQMICWLGAASGTLSKNEYQQLVDSFNMPWFELLDIILNRSTGNNTFEQPVIARDFYRGLLQKTSCEGPKKETNENINFPFNRPSLFSKPNEEYSSRVVGDYNGMDYMLIYNMYRMVFPDSLPSFLPNACPCNKSTTTVLESVGTGFGNAGNSLKTNIETFFRFPEYKQYKIYIPEYANHNIDVGHTNSSNPTAVLKVNGDLTLCGNSRMYIWNRGKLHLTRSVPNRQKEIRVTSGSELKVSSNGIIEIENLSSLIIEKGGKLIIGKNSHIILNGSASRLIIEGEIVLEGGAEIKIEWPTDSVPGTVVFKSTNVPVKVSSTGNNAILNLSSRDNDHTYIEIVGPSGLLVDNTVSKMIVQNAGILLDEKSKIMVHCSLTINNIEASPKYPNLDKPYGAAFYIYGQKNVKISNSHFTGGMMALGGKLFSYGINLPELNNVDIDHCQWGVQLYNGGIIAKNCTFSDNGIGIDLQGATMPSIIEYCNFTDNYPMGILINSTSTGELNIRNSTIDGGHECITSGGAIIRPFCNQLKNTDEAIFLNDMGFLNLNATNNAGYNRIEDNYYGVYGDQFNFYNPQYMNLAGSVDLNNGYTAFRNSYLQIKLLLCNRQDFALPPAPPAEVIINSSKNYWQLNGAPPLQDSVHYLLDFKPSWSVPRANGIIQQTDDYPSFAYINADQSSTCGWPPTKSRQLPNDTMPKDCDNKIITTPHISGKLLSEAYATSTKNLYQIGDKPEALVSYREILLAPILASTRCQSDDYFLTKSYQNSYVAFGQIYSDSLTTDTLRNGLCNEMIDLVDSLLVLGNNGDSLWEDYSYTLCLDKSDLLRINRDYNTAIDLLNNMAAEYSESPGQLEKINYQLCLNESEQASLNSGVAEYEIDSIYSCHRSFESQEIYQSGGAFVQKYSEKFKEVNKLVISLLPNPADNAIIITASQLIKSISIYDNIGKEVLRINNTNAKTTKIDVSQLPNGIYSALIDLGSSKRLKLFIVN